MLCKGLCKLQCAVQTLVMMMTMMIQSEFPIPWVAVIGRADANPSQLISPSQEFSATAIEEDCCFLLSPRSAESGAPDGHLVCPTKRRELEVERGSEPSLQCLNPWTQLCLKPEQLRDLPLHEPTFLLSTLGWLDCVFDIYN